jgi:hypothetical protein
MMNVQSWEKGWANGVWKETEWGESECEIALNGQSWWKAVRAGTLVRECAARGRIDNLLNEFSGYSVFEPLLV